MSKSSDYIDDSGKEGEARINISLAYQLHLLEIIKRYDEHYRNHEVVGMGEELVLLYDGIIDKVEEKYREKHNETEKNIHALMFRVDRASNNLQNFNAGDYGLMKIQKEKSSSGFELWSLCTNWKKELIMIMAKNGMLVTKHKGMGEGVTG